MQDQKTKVLTPIAMSQIMKFIAASIAKLRAKKEKERKKKKKSVASSSKQTGCTLQTTGTAEEVTGLIQELNKMTISDPEYAPVYYKVMALDTTGVVAKCVQPPRINTGWVETNRLPPRTQINKTGSTVNTTSTENSPATYPNNIPLGSGGVAQTETTACFGCAAEGHRISECPEVRELITKDVLQYDEDQRLRMKDGSIIRRFPGESIVQAANRLAAPHVMWAMEELVNNHENTQGCIEEIAIESKTEELSQLSDLEQPLDSHWYAATDYELDDAEMTSDNDIGEVYLTLPRGTHLWKGAQVHSVDRTVPSTRNAR
jgi:hypothetical protein